MWVRVCVCVCVCVRVCIIFVCHRGRQRGKAIKCPANHNTVQLKTNQQKNCKSCTSVRAYQYLEKEESIKLPRAVRARVNIYI